MSAAPVKLLLVEDSLSDALLLRESLSQPGIGGFEFTHVESWAEAVDQLRQQRFEVCCWICPCPTVTGRETFVRARAAAPELPIVVLTGGADEAVGLEAVRHGIQDYLIKGQAYGVQTARAIRYAIERKQAETALKQAEASLQRERDQLEARVRERTAELSEANRALQAEMAQRERAEDAHRAVLRRLVGGGGNRAGARLARAARPAGPGPDGAEAGLQIVRKQGSLPAGAARERRQAGRAWPTA